MKYFSKKKENLTGGFIVIWDLKDKVNVELLNLVCGQKKPQGNEIMIPQYTLLLWVL